MKRIFVISHYSLFQCGLEKLIQKKPGLTIVGQAKNIQLAIEQIGQLKPDTIIFDTSLVQSFAEEMLHLLTTLPYITVIGLNLRDNQVYIFRSENGSITNVNDLISALKYGTLSISDQTAFRPNRFMVSNILESGENSLLST